MEDTIVNETGTLTESPVLDDKGSNSPWSRSVYLEVEPLEKKCVLLVVSHTPVSLHLISFPEFDL